MKGSGNEVYNFTLLLSLLLSHLFSHCLNVCEATVSPLTNSFRDYLMLTKTFCLMLLSRESVRPPLAVLASRDYLEADCAPDKQKDSIIFRSRLQPRLL